MKQIIQSLCIVLLVVFTSLKANATVPRPDHVVILIMENHGYEEIIGNADAPFINSLAEENALMTSSYATIHPSQPNYLMLFSGSAQGVTNDNTPTNIPWTTPNLGASLISAGLSFRAYSDGLPSVGFTGSSSGAYRRKHAPWANWQGSGTNGISSTKHRPFTDFPTTFSNLPAVSFVVPDQNHDMHDGTVAEGDAWIAANLSAYINWAKTHNSLFILTFDEDGGDNLNHIVTIFAGEMVEPGQYSDACNHYDVLRTIEEMYELPYAGNSATATAITSIWKTVDVTAVNEITSATAVQVSPNPVYTTAIVEIKGLKNPGAFKIYDVLGNEVRDYSSELLLHQNHFTINREGMRDGIYFYRLTGDGKVYTGKVVLE